MMRQLKLVSTTEFLDPVDATSMSANEKIALLIADLERGRGGVDRDLGARAATCIRELVEQKEIAMALMLESSALLRTALHRLNALKGII